MELPNYPTKCFKFYSNIRMLISTLRNPEWYQGLKFVTIWTIKKLNFVIVWILKFINLSRVDCLNISYLFYHSVNYL